jgi:hypothetical protein
MGNPLPTEISYAPRVVVRFSAPTQQALDYSAQAQAKFHSMYPAQWDALSAAFPGVSLSPYFHPGEKMSLQNLQQHASQVSGSASPTLTAYYLVTGPEVKHPLPSMFPEELKLFGKAESDAFGIAEKVSAWPNVEIAYVEYGYFWMPDAVPQPVPPTVTSPNLRDLQGYPGPDGINAVWVRQNVQLDGDGAVIVDLENGWLLEHEDLPHGLPKIGPGLDTIWAGHGAAVLGILVGRDDDIGVVGIAPKAAVRLVSQCFQAEHGYAAIPAAAIYLALQAGMTFGDILLLETASIGFDKKLGSVPVETQALIFDLIRTATNLGITVVAPAGNNIVFGANGLPIRDAHGDFIGIGHDLADFQDSRQKSVLDTASPDFKDSGAILVGAATSAAPHARMRYSNYGSRVDCYAWGQNIVTCGDGEWGLAAWRMPYTLPLPLPPAPPPPLTAPNQSYSSFSGTSGSTAIVAGAAVLLQCWAKKHGGALDPATMRARLSDPDLNTKSKTPATDRIGVMPDLRQLIGSSSLPALAQWKASLTFAFGDKGGDGDQWYWTPGGGLRHVGPWGPDGPIGPNTRLSAVQRDAFVALMLGDLAGLLDDQATRQTIEASAAALVRTAMARTTR